MQGDITFLGNQDVFANNGVEVYRSRLFVVETEQCARLCAIAATGAEVTLHQIMPPAAPERIQEGLLTSGVSTTEHINDATKHTAPLIRRIFDVSVTNNSARVKFDHSPYHQL